MHVLMLCALEVWALPGGGGAPTLYRTLRAYGERGHRVTVVAPTVGANRLVPANRLRGARPWPTPDIPGVSFERFHLPSLQESRLPLPDLAAKADQKLRFAILFPRLCARRARAVLKREPVDLLYAYEVHGALAARLLQRERQLPTVARFQGTVLHPVLESPLARLRKYEEILAMRLPADLYVSDRRQLIDRPIVDIRVERLARFDCRLAQLIDGLPLAKVVPRLASVVRVVDPVGDIIEWKVRQSHSPRAGVREKHEEQIPVNR